MANIIKSLYRGILRNLPDKPALYLIYFRGYHKILNLKSPKYYDEKIQWLKLYGHLDELSTYVDKYEVRRYVKDTVGEQYLNDLYGVYDTPEQVDFQSLPNQFVLKCTNGSGSLMIVRDKKKLDMKKAKQTMNQWLSDDFYKLKKEPQYKNIKNRIIVEKYLEDDTGSLRDYKFYCFDGIPYYYNVIEGRFTDETCDMYDISGKMLRNVVSYGIKKSKYILQQPENFPELVEAVKRLASPFRFVRVDFYIVNGRSYFGELTFTESAGSEPYFPRSFDLEMAKRIKLGRILKKQQ